MAVHDQPQCIETIPLVNRVQLRKALPPSALATSGYNADEKWLTFWASPELLVEGCSSDGILLGLPPLDPLIHPRISHHPIMGHQLGIPPQYFPPSPA